MAGEDQFTQDFRRFFQAHGFEVFLPPTVSAELAFSVDRSDERKRSLARKALSGIVKWGLIACPMKPVWEDIAVRFSERLRERGLLPPDEKHDGEILAETSLMGVPVLVTRDGHLLDIDETSLVVAFQEADLVPVQTVHPRRFMQAAQRFLNL
ncbi:MAG: hypothetical protein ABSH34_13450 [Verrucomicrobiota bacterium]